jgi:lipoate-protein ligase A
MRRDEDGDDLPADCAPGGRTMMQGAYKTPGGKLVAVEFEVDQGRLRGVRVHGDFFLYPEEVLGDITRALEGLPADLGEAEIASRVRAALPEGTEWLGSSPEAVGVAVRRALSVEELEATHE